MIWKVLDGVGGLVVLLVVGAIALGVVGTIVDVAKELMEEEEEVATTVVAPIWKVSLTEDLIDEAATAMNRLEMEMDDFQTEDWRKNVPDVYERVRYMRDALDELIERTESLERDRFY